jgi:hypothetical protein
MSVFMEKVRQFSHFFIFFPLPLKNPENSNEITQLYAAYVSRLHKGLLNERQKCEIQQKNVRSGNISCCHPLKYQRENTGCIFRQFISSELILWLMVMGGPECKARTKEKVDFSCLLEVRQHAD